MARFIKAVMTWAMAWGPSATSCSMTTAMTLSFVLSGIGRSFLAGETPHTLDLPVAAPRGGNRQPRLRNSGANFQTSGYTTHRHDQLHSNLELVVVAGQERHLWNEIVADGVSNGANRGFGEALAAQVHTG